MPARLLCIAITGLFFCFIVIAFVCCRLGTVILQRYNAD